MGIGTILSRVTGLLRTTTLAAALGVTSLADSFDTTSSIPTMLLVLVSGGTLSAVLVPGLAGLAPVVTNVLAIAGTFAYMAETGSVRETAEWARELTPRRPGVDPGRQAP